MENKLDYILPQEISNKLDYTPFPQEMPNKINYILPPET